MSLLKFLLSAALTLGLAAPAAAQLYSWRDSNGHLVVSNTRQADGSAPTRTYAVSQSTAVRTTRYVAPTRSGTYTASVDGRLVRVTGTEPWTIEVVFYTWTGTLTATREEARP